MWVQINAKWSCGVTTFIDLRLDVHVYKAFFDLIMDIYMYILYMQLLTGCLTVTDICIDL